MIGIARSTGAVWACGCVLSSGRIKAVKGTASWIAFAWPCRKLVSKYNYNYNYTLKFATHNTRSSRLRLAHIYGKH
jgi:hypothetical protein